MLQPIVRHGRQKGAFLLGMQSLDRGLRILEYLAKKKGAGVTEISEAFQIDKSTASRILSTFVEHDMAFKDAATGKYRLSVGPLLFSYRAMSYHEIMDIAHPILLDLAAKTGETAHLCVLQQDQIYVLDQVKSKRNQFMKDPSLPGMREPLHSSAVGKVILAYMQPEQARRLLENTSLDVFTDKTISDIDELFGQLEQVRKNGYAIDNEEFSRGVICAAVPVFDSYGFVTHSIGISGNGGYIQSPEIFQQMIAVLLHAGKKLTKAYSAAGGG